MKKNYRIKIDETRDALLSELSKLMLRKSYMKMDFKNFQELFATVSTAYSDNEAHAQRLYDYMSNRFISSIFESLKVYISSN